jgi:hypothetical protein
MSSFKCKAHTHWQSELSQPQQTLLKEGENSKTFIALLVNKFQY